MMADEYVSHFVFWKTAKPIDPVKASVKGQFGGLDIELKSIELIGNPAEKNDEPVNPDYAELHLTAYELASFPPFQATVMVSNQFGERKYELGSPVLLLVPAFKSHDAKLPDNVPRGPHFLCYQVLHPPTLRKEVKLKDQFKKFDVQSLTLAYLGVPVDKNGEGMWQKGEEVHLALYEIAPYVAPHPPQTTIYIRDQFQKGLQLTAMTSSMLGVPSKKTVL